MVGLACAPPGLMAPAGCIGVGRGDEMEMDSRRGISDGTREACGCGLRPRRFGFGLLMRTGSVVVRQDPKAVSTDLRTRTQFARAAGLPYNWTMVLCPFCVAKMQGLSV